VWWVVAGVVDGATAAWSWLRGRTLLVRWLVALAVFAAMTAAGVLCGPSWLYWGLFAALVAALAWAAHGMAVWMRAIDRADAANRARRARADERQRCVDELAAVAVTAGDPLRASHFAEAAALLMGPDLEGVDR
jgi:hypothetical protein